MVMFHGGRQKNKHLFTQIQGKPAKKGAENIPAFGDHHVQVPF